MDSLTDPVQIICDAFPSALSEDVRFVWNHLLTHYPSDAADVIFRRDATIWQLLDGECITIPYIISAKHCLKPASATHAPWNSSENEPIGKIKNGTRHKPRPVFLFILPLLLDGVGLAAEQQRHAPDRGQAHQRVDHAADSGGLPTKQIGHQVKSEQADAAPVQTTDNRQRQGDTVYDHHGFFNPLF